jgi:site-specific recombinase XerD
MCHPRDLGVDEIREYLSHLAVEKHVAASTQNIALSSLLFLYKQVLLLDLPYIDHIERAKQPDRLPVVFTVEEVRHILDQLEGLLHLSLWLCHAPAPQWLRYSHYAGIARAQGCEDDNDLHPCS